MNIKSVSGESGKLLRGKSLNGFARQSVSIEFSEF